MQYMITWNERSQKLVCETSVACHRSWLPHSFLIRTRLLHVVRVHSVGGVRASCS